MIELSIEQDDTPTYTLKEKAVDFLQLVASGQVREAYQKYIGPNFLHHNPFFRGDADSLMLAMEEDAANNPQKILEVKMAIEEADTVAVHSHVRQNPDDLGWAIIHIFRFQDNQIVEMWDVGQAVPEDSPNANGVF
ncbi:nuclear transport factor 2 family protein [Heyndrickxia oleronia]|uniref:Nuclear transport factor 2 family protein n=1 Tax=Heyndrickxia oleronia TaxID=38875 RepID=A0AAW6T2A6_9BACI|nr:nuclear transport factor 2 family protein [Heyndrickxia oleronia]MDH5164450.1 nuclear transport factor 2 family protein [Heyndrickxia oleronia]